MSKQNKLSKKDISSEQWRMYRWLDVVSKKPVYVKIHRPVFLWFHSVGATHRVQDISGVVHIVPAPGNFGCVVSYLPYDLNNAVQF